MKDFEADLYREEGSTLWALLNARPTVDGEGKLLSIGGITEPEKGEGAPFGVEHHRETIR